MVMHKYFAKSWKEKKSCKKDCENCFGLRKKNPITKKVLFFAIISFDPADQITDYIITNM
jgi:hypothetical protein